jgi:hypothetical protein
MTSERKVDPNSLVPTSYGINRDRADGVADSIFYITVTIDGKETMFKHWDYSLDGGATAMKQVARLDPWSDAYENGYQGFSNSRLVLGQRDLSIKDILSAIPEGEEKTVTFRLYVGNQLNGGAWAITSTFDYDFDVVGTKDTTNPEEVDKGALQALHDEILAAVNPAVKGTVREKVMDPELYTNWAQLGAEPTGAYWVADALLANEEATQAQVDEALANLKAAVDALVLKDGGDTVEKGDISGNGTFDEDDIVALFTKFQQQKSLTADENLAFFKATGYSVPGKIMAADVRALAEALALSLLDF